MSSLPRCGFSSIESQRQLIATYKTKNVNMRHRNYSSNKFIKTLMLNDSSSQKVIDRDTCTQAISGALEKKELKRYCISKFRSGVQQQKLILKRKNSSLKLFKKDQTIKLNQPSKIEHSKDSESYSHRKDERVNNSQSKETISSQKTISVKRRVEILKMSRSNIPKLQIKDTKLEKQSCSSKAEVSF